jgi:hypothetical protein
MTLTDSRETMESISMDFIMGLPEDGGIKTIWVIVDRLTKIAYFIVYRDTMGP